MAQRRMFSMKIVDTDAFLEMPLSTQSLYFHLAMRADDDGFVSNPKKIGKMLGTQDDDYKLLCAKKFIIPFENGVCVIKHWLIHNLVRGDRYMETQWKEQKNLLFTDPETKKYTINKPENNNVIPNGNQMATQVRLGKVRLGKKDIETENVAKEFSLKGEIQKMEESPRRDMNIIAMYFEKRMPDIQSLDQLSVAIKRHLRAAKNLEPFTDNQILDAVPKAKVLSEEYTLETIVKVLTK